MRSFAAIFICAVLAVLGGCTASGRLSKEHKVYTCTTGRQAMEVRFASDALVDVGNVYYKIQASCEGTNCIPEEVRLSFYLSNGSSNIYLSSRALTIRAAGNRYHWQRRQWRNVFRSPPVVGRIISVTLDTEALKLIANAKDVTGSLASQPFTWSYEMRKPLRKLLDQMKGINFE